MLPHKSPKHSPPNPLPPLPLLSPGVEAPNGGARESIQGSKGVCKPIVGTTKTFKMKSISQRLFHDLIS